MKQLTNKQMKQTVKLVNASTSRLEALMQQIDPKRNIDKELGYPDELTLQDYTKMFEREGYGNRVVTLKPNGCWATPPTIRENEDSNETTFEADLNRVIKDVNLFSYFLRADILSGIGSYGALLLGFDDGEDLTVPISGVGGDGKKEGDAKHSLMYVRALGEKEVTVHKVVTDPKSPRNGLPEMYNVQMVTPTERSGTTGSSDKPIHWSRIIHLAEGLLANEIYGSPRQKCVFNYLYNVQKILGGSAEMYWMGAFPGLSLETQPDMADAEIDMDTVKQSLFDYQNKLKRFLVLQGLNAKPLDVQIASPKEHMDVQIDGICATIECPKRIFLGSERGELASSQDTISWNGKLMGRNENYLTPYVVRPTIDRLVMTGVLSEPADYEVVWSDLNSATDAQQAEVAGKTTESLAKYVQGDVESVMPLELYLRHVLKFDDDQVDATIKDRDELLQLEEQAGIEMDESVAAQSQ